MKRIPEAFLALLLAAQVAGAAPVRISVELAGGPAGGPATAGELEIVPVGAKSGAEKKISVPAQAPGEQEIDLRPDLTWEVRFVTKGFWGEPIIVLPHSQISERRLRVFPAGKVRAGVILPTGEKPLPSLALRLQAAFAPKADPLDATVACPVETGVLSCEAPAGNYDLRLRAEGGFAPVYRWDVRISPGKATDLGELKLQRGASVSGWVQTAEGRPPSRECRLKLSPGSASTADLKLRDQLDKTSFEVQPNDRGFFQIVGVPPGRYELTARQPGFAETRVAPVDVRPDLESQVLERLVLARPVTFDITLDPPLEPYGSPWRIELSRRAGASEPPSDFLSGTASQEGVWRVPGVAPGTYELLVRGDQKAIWHQEFLEVHPGQAPLRIDIPVLRVEGRVLIGKEPLAATVWLSQKGGRRLRFDSDSRGRFSGVLPGPGLWSPQVQSEAEKLRLSLEPLEIKPPQGKSVATVEIRLPDTRLSGEVVDESDRPVPAAQIAAAPIEKKGTDLVTADEHGEFSIRGLSPGAWVVKAEGNGRQSDFLPVSLPEEGEAPRLRIVVRKLQTLEGRVVSAAGGVPGAMVLAWAAFNGQSASSVADAVSGADGSFHVDLPAGTSVLNLAVLPPGYAMRLTSVAVSPGQPVEIPVESQGGTLILDSADGGPAPLLAHGGVFALPYALRMWARMQGERAADSGRLVLPNVEAGPYSFCRGAAAVSRVKEGGEPPAASCSSGVLAPNGELVLRNPGAAATR